MIPEGKGSSISKHRPDVSGVGWIGSAKFWAYPKYNLYFQITWEFIYLRISFEGTDILT